MRILFLLLLGSSSLIAQNAPSLQFRGSQPLSKHVAITTPPPPSSGPGEKVSLTVEMSPNPGIHVYAPGAKDYLQVKLTLKPQADVTVGKLTYPKSEMVHFAALDETVPVYRKPFTLLQDVTLKKSLKPGSMMTLAGTLEFQACDDQVCFVPESVPVSWSLPVK
jgi:DsbC/DsbD-like thiol-disulfide interchange protein